MALTSLFTAEVTDADLIANYVMDLCEQYAGKLHVGLEMQLADGVPVTVTGIYRTSLVEIIYLRHADIQVTHALSRKVLGVYLGHPAPADVIQAVL